MDRSAETWHGLALLCFDGQFCVIYCFLEVGVSFTFDRHLNWTEVWVAVKMEFLINEILSPWRTDWYFLIRSGTKCINQMAKFACLCENHKYTWSPLNWGHSKWSKLLLVQWSKWSLLLISLIRSLVRSSWISCFLVDRSTSFVNI